MSATSVLIKIARKFQLKMSLGQAGSFDLAPSFPEVEFTDIDKEIEESLVKEFKERLKSKLREVITLFRRGPLEELTVVIPARLANRSEDFEKFINQDDETAEQFFTSHFRSTRPEDQPFYTQSAEALKDILVVKSASHRLFAKLDEYSVSGSAIVAYCMIIMSLLVKLANVSGLDTFGVHQPNWLNVINAVTNTYTAMGNYGDVTELNSKAKRELREKIGAITRDLNSVAQIFYEIKNLLDNANFHKLFSRRQTEALSEFEMPDVDTSRSIKDLENNEIVRFMQVTELAPPNREMLYYNEYIKPYPEKALLLRKTFRHPKFKRIWAHATSADEQRSVLNIEKIRNSIDELKSHIETLKSASRDKEKAKQELLFGTPEPISKLKPSSEIRTFETIIENIGQRFKSYLNRNGYLAIMAREYNKRKSLLSEESLDEFNDKVKSNLDDLEIEYDNEPSIFRDTYNQESIIDSVFK